MKIKFISVDFQKEFSDEKGQWFNRGTSVSFIKNELIPYFRKNSIIINEIISDYRQPRPGDRGNGCIPGTYGYESDIPNDIKNSNQWLKCMNNPIWIRENIGNKDLDTGLPYQNPEAFNNWILQNIGTPDNVDLIVLFGLTMDCCLLCTAQELNYRGYKVKMLYEATDPMKNDSEYKKLLATNSPLLIWSGVIHFDELVKLLDNKLEE